MQSSNLSGRQLAVEIMQQYHELFNTFKEQIAAGYSQKDLDGFAAASERLFARLRLNEGLFLAENEGDLSAKTQLLCQISELYTQISSTIEEEMTRTKEELKLIHGLKRARRSYSIPELKDAVFVDKLK